VHRILDARFLFLHLGPVAAPTLMMATPPTSFARRSCSFAVVVGRRVLDLRAQLFDTASIAAACPAPR
jgi:hypothetical protein